MTSENQNPPSGEQQAAYEHTETPTQIGHAATATTELEPPPSNPKCKNACQEKKHWLDYVTFGMEFLGLVVLCVYAAYTIKIYCANNISANAAKSAADTAIDALHNGQRAFVNGTLDRGVVDGSDGKVWRVRVFWRNDGDTPTRTLITHLNFSGMRNQSLPDEFTFPDTWQKGEGNNPLHLDLVAKGRASGMEVFIPVSIVQKIRTYYYFWGWARYHDVFDGTPEHIVHFCAEANTTTVPSTLTSVRVTPMDACLKYNCADESCKQQ